MFTRRASPKNVVEQATSVEQNRTPALSREMEAFPVRPFAHHYHLAWSGMLALTIEGARFYRNAAARAGITCHWHKIKTVAALEALHRALRSALLTQVAQPG